MEILGAGLIRTPQSKKLKHLEYPTWNICILIETLVTSSTTSLLTFHFASFIKNYLLWTSSVKNSPSQIQLSRFLYSIYNLVQQKISTSINLRSTSFPETELSWPKKYFFWRFHSLDENHIRLDWKVDISNISQLLGATPPRNHRIQQFCILNRLKTSTACSSFIYSWKC